MQRKIIISDQERIYRSSIEQTKKRLLALQVDLFLLKEVEKLLTSTSGKEIGKSRFVNSIEISPVGDGNHVNIKIYFNSSLINDVAWSDLVNELHKISSTMEKSIVDHQIGLHLKNRPSNHSTENRLYVWRFEIKDPNCWGTYGDYAPDGNADSIEQGIVTGFPQ